MNENEGLVKDYIGKISEIEVSDIPSQEKGQRLNDLVDFILKYFPGIVGEKTQTSLIERFIGGLSAVAEAEKSPFKRKALELLKERFGNTQ